MVKSPQHLSYLHSVTSPVDTAVAGVGQPALKHLLHGHMTFSAIHKLFHLIIMLHHPQRLKFLWPGVATAFAAPIGGMLFTIEEGASFYSTSIFWRGFLSTGIGVLTLHFLVEFTVRLASRSM